MKASGANEAAVRTLVVSDHYCHGSSAEWPLSETPYQLFLPLYKGACTYDVCTGRGTPKADAIGKLSKGD